MPRVKEHTQLLNGCHRTDLAVIPKNWNTQKAKTKKEWIIWYRFVDPEHLDKYPQGKPVKIRGMNVHTDLQKKQAATQELLDLEYDLLDVQHYNPITKKYMVDKSNQVSEEEDNIVVDIPPTTPLIPALEQALKSKDMEEDSKKDIKNKIPHVKAAAEKVRFEGRKLSEMEIGRITRKHVRALLNQIGKNKGDKWTANNFNRYRTDLHIVFSELNELEAMEANPIDGIKRKHHEPKKRETLNEEERIKVDKYLKEKYYSFWRFLQIFFESGSREIEMLRLERDHVDLKKKKFKVLVKKGQYERYVSKPIKENVYPLWVEILAIADALPSGGKEETLYVFSEGLEPMWRDTPIRADQITKRWYRLVKKKDKELGMKITADFYSMKHLRTTTIIDSAVSQAVAQAVAAAELEAAELNGHTTVNMVQKVYDTKREERDLKINRGPAKRSA